MVIELMNYSLMIPGVCWEAESLILLSKHSWCSKPYLFVLLMCECVCLV